ncbi:MAG: DUF1800 domain-containing protein [Pseudomonadota bacterium]
MQQRAIALNRFGLGARAAEWERASDPELWLRSQLTEFTKIDDGPTTAEILSDVLLLQRNARQTKRAEDREMFRRRLREHYQAQTLSRYQRAATTDAPFRERLVHFWSNHFAVSADKPPLAAIVGRYEDEVVRPHFLGRFADLLRAALQHPAMIYYLDNQQSIGPRSRAAQLSTRRRSNRPRGLNENLAREVLELHTLGVDGGYDQRDVQALAKMLTGWSTVSVREAERSDAKRLGSFQFRSATHEPGAQRLLGRRYAAPGIAQASNALEDLAVHPATATHLATKLARHFVDDRPDPALVTRLASSYLASSGELRSLYTALIESPEARRAEPKKYKSPHEFVISVHRALAHEPRNPRALTGTLATLGQPAFRPGSPAGWPDTVADWGGADALLKRIEWVGAAGRLVTGPADPRAVAEAALGPTLTMATRRAVERAGSRAQALTLLFASPEFLRR